MGLSRNEWHIHLPGASRPLAEPRYSNGPIQRIYTRLEIDPFGDRSVLNGGVRARVYEVTSPCNRLEIDPFWTEGGSTKGANEVGRPLVGFVQGANEVESPCNRLSSGVLILK